MGAALLLETLAAWLAGDAAAVEQDHDAATYCWTLTKADGQLSRSMGAEEAERAVRAYDPWPGAFVEYKEARLAIWRSRYESAEAPEPGTLTIIGKAPAIAFGGGWLVLEEVQKPGGKRMGGADFLNGERGTMPPMCGLRD
jgi:methionyl-tRNA formyltransferase